MFSSDVEEILAAFNEPEPPCELEPKDFDELRLAGVLRLPATCVAAAHARARGSGYTERSDGGGAAASTGETG